MAFLVPNYRNSQAYSPSHSQHWTPAGHLTWGTPSVTLPTWRSRLRSSFLTQAMPQRKSKKKAGLWNPGTPPDRTKLLTHYLWVGVDDSMDRDQEVAPPRERRKDTPRPTFFMWQKQFLNLWSPSIGSPPQFQLLLTHHIASWLHSLTLLALSR